MVRHEAAEALGAIPSDEVLEVLNRFAKDEIPIVRESCEAALDIHDYWTERA
jgi:deoxyhypusine monooxygenase